MNGSVHTARKQATSKELPANLRTRLHCALGLRDVAVIGRGCRDLFGAGLATLLMRRVQAPVPLDSQTNLHLSE